MAENAGVDPVYSPLFFVFFSPSHKGPPTVYLHVFFGHRIFTFLSFYLFVLPFAIKNGLRGDGSMKCKLTRRTV